MNTKSLTPAQMKFLAQNRHIVPINVIEFPPGMQAVLCTDMGTDSEGRHYGPYLLWGSAALQGLDDFMGAQAHDLYSDHLWRRVRPGDIVSILADHSGHYYEGLTVFEHFCEMGEDEKIIKAHIFATDGMSFHRFDYPEDRILGSRSL